MKQAGIHMKYWPEAVRTANYLRNLSPLTKTGITPYEAWENIKPDLSHIRIFGSKAFAVKMDQKKFDSKATPCVLLGYEGESIYRLLSQDGKIFRSSTVIFEENHFMEASNHKNLRLNANKRASDPTTDVGENVTKRHRVDDSMGMPEDGNDVVEPIDPALQDEADDVPTGSGPGISEEEFPSPLETTRVTRSTTKKAPSGFETGRSDRNRSPSLPPDTIRVSSISLLTIAQSTEPTEPLTYNEAVKDDLHSKDWQDAMQEEYNSLVDNQTWDLVPQPSGRHVLGGKWVYKLKRGAAGEILRYKARWVVRGFEQQEGVDFDETFASVVKPMSYKAIFAIAAAEDLEVEQMDVKTAFLYGDIDQELYVQQPTGREDPKHRNHVCKLRKALYGLKQSPRIWYNTLAAFLGSLGFEPLIADYSVFRRGRVIIAIYVDDLLLVGPSKPEIQDIKSKLSERFKMSDLGPCGYYLGMTVTRDRAHRTLKLGQSAYIEKILRDQGLWECNPNKVPISPSSSHSPSPTGYTADSKSLKAYQSGVGSLMYVMLGTRPDIAFAVSVVSRYAANPGPAHHALLKQIFRYLRGTSHWQLVFRGALKPAVGYTDSDYAGDIETRRSTSGYVFNLGSGAISWSSKRQATVALSTCEAEYVGQTQAAKEAIWLGGLLEQIQQSNDGSLPMVIYGDNQGAIALAKNPQFHARTKHIDVQQHFVREKVAEGKIDLAYIPTEEQIADGLTKALPRDKFEKFRAALGLEAGY